MLIRGLAYHGCVVWAVVSFEGLKQTCASKKNHCLAVVWAVVSFEGLKPSGKIVPSAKTLVVWAVVSFEGLKLKP